MSDTPPTPATDPLSESARSAAEQRALAGAAVQTVALLAAVTLSVYKPGRTRPRAARLAAR